MVDGRYLLRRAGIDDADLESEVLLRHVLRIERAELMRRLSDTMDPPDLERFEGLIQRRLAREPTAYILGRREFYGREFIVTPDVLIPRPDTETLAEAALELARAWRPPTRAPSPDEMVEPFMARRLAQESRLVIVDVGTGSGAIAVTLALGLPAAKLYASDVSQTALLVAQRNADRLGANRRIVFLQGDLMMPPRVDMIVANLPYIPAQVIDGLEPEVRDYEPRLALYGGDDGLDLIRQLLTQAPRHLNSGGSVCLEIGLDQGEAVSALAVAALPGAEVSVRNDLGGRPRVVLAKTRP